MMTMIIMTTDTMIGDVAHPIDAHHRVEVPVVIVDEAIAKVVVAKVRQVLLVGAKQMQKPV